MDQGKGPGPDPFLLENARPVMGQTGLILFSFPGLFSIIGGHR